MKLSNLILHKDILLIHADIRGNDYIFTVRWKLHDNKMGGEWKLASYMNNTTGNLDLSEDEINTFLDQINPNWDWEHDQKEIMKAIKID